MAISREVATKTYKDHVEKRTAADELSINLALGELDAVSEKTAADDKLPSHVRKERLREAIATLEGRNRARDNQSATPAQSVSTGDMSIDSVSEALSRHFNLSAGAVAHLRTMLSDDPNVRIEYDRNGTPSRERKLAEELRQAKDELAAEKNKTIQAQPVSPFTPSPPTSPAPVPQPATPTTPAQPAPASNPAQSQQTANPAPATPPPSAPANGGSGGPVQDTKPGVLKQARNLFGSGN